MGVLLSPGSTEPLCSQLVDQDAIHHGLTYLVVVLRLQFDIRRSRAERFAALAFDDVLAVMALSPDFLLVC